MTLVHRRRTAGSFLLPALCLALAAAPASAGMHFAPGSTGSLGAGASSAEAELPVFVPNTLPPGVPGFDYRRTPVPPADLPIRRAPPDARNDPARMMTRSISRDGSEGRFEPAVLPAPLRHMYRNGNGDLRIREAAPAPAAPVI